MVEGDDTVHVDLEVQDAEFTGTVGLFEDDNFFSFGCLDSSVEDSDGVLLEEGELTEGQDVVGTGPCGGGSSNGEVESLEDG